MTNFKIDAITWNDLSMDQVYEKLNRAESSVGQEYLKKVLQNTLLEEGELQKRSERAEYFRTHSDFCKTVQKVFRDLGKTKKISLYDYMFRFQEIKPAGTGIHFLLIVLLLAAIAMIFIRPVIGIIALVVMFIINISSYFKYKAEIESYFMCFKYIIRMLRAGSRLLAVFEKNAGTGMEAAPDSFGDLLQGIREDISVLAPMKRGAWLLTNSVSGSLIDVIMDYIRMLFHVDIIRFYQMRKLAVEQTDRIDHLFRCLGEVETGICIALYRESLENWCVPVFTDTTADGARMDTKESHVSSFRTLDVKGMYHPLTETIVRNDLHIDRSVLLTGSNASGKSTFLKQLAINQIFAQTIDTCLADQFQTSFFKVMSSMALTDNLLGKESYFIVEIKSLKRIFDEIGEVDTSVPVMCFIDEVLRGTNTKERVAASSQILKKMAHQNVLCFAATHDIELTDLLKEDMENYHFEEFVEGNDVNFDYKIRSGPATTRNAIRLMQAFGFDTDIIQAANQLADQL